MRFLHLAFAMLALTVGLSAKEEEKAPDLKKITVRMEPESAEICLGEPSFVKFIVTNASDQPVKISVGGDYQNGLGRPDSFTVTAKNATGIAAPKREAFENMGGMSTMQTIAAGGEYVFRLFLPHWVVISEPGVYDLKANRKLQFVTDFFKPAGELPVEASTRLTVVPANPAKLGAMIDRLGLKVVDAHDAGDVRDEWDALLEIKDERVIPFLLKALEKGDYGTRFQALNGLGNFNSPAALGGIQKSLTMPARDARYKGSAEAQRSEAANLRHAAAAALSKSPHPGATAVLVAQRHDESYAVRLTAVHAMKEKLAPSEAIPLLREMAKDSNEMVKGEARRYLRELEAGQ